ncbi:hypothetical protein [Demequina aurantiaca]|uniref:hypothetical protein n=1 Tax=Demequina aurantiaca TaxID=676200 RepID=UPI000A584473|nr:hypothetical protein [Demequina aurantiaca]
MRSRFPAAQFIRPRTLRAGAAVLVGAVLLAGCSSEDSQYKDFCDTSRSLEAQTEQIDGLVPDQDALTAAGQGDFTALNAWGAEAQETVADVGTQFQTARDTAPDEEIADALGTYLEMLDVFQQMAIASTNANDVDDFTATLGDLNDQGSALSDDITEAGKVLSAAEELHCN